MNTFQLAFFVYETTWNDTFQEIGSRFKVNLFFWQIHVAFSSFPTTYNEPL